MSSPGANTAADARQLRSLVDAVADQLCHAVDGQFDFTVKVEVQDETIEKLQMLINFVLDAARRSVTESEAQRQALERQVAERRQAEEALGEAPWGRAPGGGGARVRRRSRPPAAG